MRVISHWLTPVRLLWSRAWQRGVLSSASRHTSYLSYPTFNLSHTRSLTWTSLSTTSPWVDQCSNVHRTRPLAALSLYCRCFPLKYFNSKSCSASEWEIIHSKRFLKVHIVQIPLRLYKSSCFIHPLHFCRNPVAVQAKGSLYIIQFALWPSPRVSHIMSHDYDIIIVLL